MVEDGLAQPVAVPVADREHGEEEQLHRADGQEGVGVIGGRAGGGDHGRVLGSGLGDYRQTAYRPWTPGPRGALLPSWLHRCSPWCPGLTAARSPQYLSTPGHPSLNSVGCDCGTLPEPHVLRNVSSNWIVTLLSILSAYLLTPFTLHQLGNDGYGAWNLIASITGYIGLLALGVPMASVRYFAQYAAEGDMPKLNAAVGSCTALYLALGAVALVVGGGLYAVFRLSYNLPMAIR